MPDTPFHISSPYLVLLAVFTILILVAFGAFKLESWIQKKMKSKKMRRVNLLPFLLVLPAVAVVIGGLFIPASLAYQKIPASNFDIAEQAINEKYGLGLKEDHDAFDPLHGNVNEKWEVVVLNNAGDEFEMELRFDKKTGEPMLSFADKSGYPLP